MTARRPADRGCRGAHTKPEQLALGALAAPARVLGGQADDELLQLLVGWRPPGAALRAGPGAGDQPPVPVQQRLGLGEEQGQRSGGNARPIAASSASAGSNLERGAWRRWMVSW
jgi:hypothetical protein